jgi:hypothetical protein
MAQNDRVFGQNYPAMAAKAIERCRYAIAYIRRVTRPASAWISNPFCFASSLTHAACNDG